MEKTEFEAYVRAKSLVENTHYIHQEGSSLKLFRAIPTGIQELVLPRPIEEITQQELDDFLEL